MSDICFAEELNGDEDTKTVFRIIKTLFYKFLSRELFEKEGIYNDIYNCRKTVSNLKNRVLGQRPRIEKKQELS